MDATWETVQINAFTKWVNAKLDKGRDRYLSERPGIEYAFAHITDITRDLQDGTTLLALLYAITGFTAKYTANPVHLVHKRENIDIAISYLKNQKIEMVNLGAEDIEEGSCKLTLALIWRFILLAMYHELHEAGDDDAKQLQQKLLSWCRVRTAGYERVDIRNFNHSWTDGLGMSALVHSELGNFVYDDGPAEAIAERAFQLAHQQLQVPILVSGAELARGECDDKSIITYLLGLYTGIKKNEHTRQQQAAADARQRAAARLESCRRAALEQLDLQLTASESLAAAKRALDCAYLRVREAELARTASAVEYLVDRDYLHRQTGSYLPYAADAAVDQALAFSFAGLHDSTAVLDSLRRWQVAVGSQTTGVSRRGYHACLEKLAQLPLTVSYTSARALLHDLLATVQATLAEAETTDSAGQFALANREEELTANEQLAIIGERVKQAEQRFAATFAAELSREAELASRYSPAASDSLADTLVPNGSAYDLATFEPAERYRYVVAAGLLAMHEGDSPELVPISTSHSK